MKCNRCFMGCGKNITPLSGWNPETCSECKGSGVESDRDRQVRELLEEIDKLDTPSSGCHERLAMGDMMRRLQKLRSL